MEISFESNLREWTAAMTRFEREQIPFATALALTETARDAKAEHVKLLPVIFDRPTRFTMNSLKVTPATKAHLVSSVFFKDSSRHRRHYLMPQVEGGTRPHKRFEAWLIRRGIMQQDEYAVPARGVRLDGSGNMSAGTIVQILSQLAVSPDAMQWETARSRKRAGASRARYFVPRLGSALPRGVWKRIGRSSIQPVLIFVKSVLYSPRYDFFEITRRSADAHFPGNFALAFGQALSTARK